MNLVWQFTIEDYEAIYALAVKMGIKPGESMEPAIFAYAKEKNLKPAGATELNKEEFLNEQVSHDKKVLDISHDNQGNPTYNIIKPKEEGQQ